MSWISTSFIDTLSPASLSRTDSTLQCDKSPQHPPPPSRSKSSECDVSIQKDQFLIEDLIFVSPKESFRKVEYIRVHSYYPWFYPTLFHRSDYLEGGIVTTQS